MTCPVAHDFDPLSGGFPHGDPYPLLERLRSEHRVFYAPALDMYVVTRHADITEILAESDGKRFSATNASSPVSPMSGEAEKILADGGFRRVPTLSNADPPRHGPMGAGVRKCMSGRRLRMLEPRVRAKAEELVSAMLAKPVADLVADLAFPLPAFAGLGLLGFPEEDFDQIKQWTGGRVLLTYGSPTPAEQEQAAHDVVAFWKYVEAFIASRADDPQDDLTSDMIALHRSDPDAPDMDDLVNIVYSIALAGHETTTNFIANGTLALLRRPEVWQAIRNDPSVIPRATEEAMRFDPPVLAWRRRAVVDATIGGVVVPAGAQLVLLFAAADRDPGRFPEPETFDPARTNAFEHLGFGKGVHYCKGAPLARIEMQICLELLTERAPDMTLAEEPGDGDYLPNLSLRGPRRLLVRTGR